MTETDAPTAAHASELKLGFARGVAPSKWADRFSVAHPSRSLALVPFNAPFGRPLPGSPGDADLDVVLERALPGEAPSGTAAPAARHAVRLYTEAIALIVPVDHELAEHGTIDAADLELVHLLDHPGHASAWPEPEPWHDPASAPRTVSAALDLVGSGLGAVLLPRPLARHMIDKRLHAILSLTGDELAGSSVWATWETAHDSAKVQDLIGILRGRSSRSSRGERSDTSGADSKSTPKKAPKTPRITPPRKASPKSKRSAQSRKRKPRR